MILMILTMRRTTWTTLQGLRATGFPITHGRSLAPTPASGSGEVMSAASSATSATLGYAGLRRLHSATLG